MMIEKDIPENFVARQCENFEVVLPRSKIEEAMKKVAEATNAPGYHDAMELVWFKFDPNGDTCIRACVSMLLTLYRCTLDGNVRPPLNLEELYTRTYKEMDVEQGSFPGSLTP